MSHIYNKGITLVELIVAVGILTFAVAGPMTLAASSLRATHDAENELVATHLAEEGLEVIHSIRDNNSAKDLDPQSSGYTAWITSPINIMQECGMGGHGCGVDVTKHVGGGWIADAIIKCQNPACNTTKAIKINKTTGLYRQGGDETAGSEWLPTPFSRIIKIVVDDQTSQVHVVSTVTYPSITGSMRTITVSEVLYNWFPSLQMP